MNCIFSNFSQSNPLASKDLPGFLSAGMTLLGPRFTPASPSSRFRHLYTRTSSKKPPSIALFTLRLVIMIYLLYFPELRRCPACEDSAKQRGWSVGFREVTGMFHHENAIGGIIACTATCLARASTIMECRKAGGGGAISTWLETGSSGTARKKKRKKSKEIGGEKTPQVEFGMTSAEFWEPLAYWQVPRKSEL